MEEGMVKNRVEVIVRDNDKIDDDEFMRVTAGENSAHYVTLPITIRSKDEYYINLHLPTIVQVLKDKPDMLAVQTLTTKFPTMDKMLIAYSLHSIPNIDDAKMYAVAEININNEKHICFAELYTMRSRALVEFAVKKAKDFGWIKLYMYDDMLVGEDYKNAEEKQARVENILHGLKIAYTDEE
jgi:hypothetical protein